MTQQTYTESKEPDVGGITTTGMNPLTVLQTIGKALFFDYNFFYDVDYTLTEVQCEAITGGVWQSSTNSCRTPNDWMIVRYILFFPITIGMLVFLGLTIWHAIRG